VRFGSGIRCGLILEYRVQKGSKSTTRSLRTGRFRIGSTTILPWFATSGPTCVSHASRLFELICIAHDPQITLRQE
jgi:hypothetical protein